MDTTKEYVKMCEKAYHDIGKDNVLTFSERLMTIYSDGEEYGRWQDRVNTGNYKDWFPLYNQDQLQDMVGDEDIFNLSWYFGMNMYLRFKDGKKNMGGEFYYHQFTSMEQLWLAFLMKEKYNKIWNGEDWNES